jgi:hypothetical protein
MKTIQRRIVARTWRESYGLTTPDRTENDVLAATPDGADPGCPQGVPATPTDA